jgi:ABC-type multidrug transport system ATPase subunit
MHSLTIKAAALGKRFNREWIFKDFTFDFHSNTIYAITGPNGSGKSTLLQVLWGQMPPSTGTISYRSDGNTLPEEKIYQSISIATPYMDLIDEFTLAEQVDFHFKTKPIKDGHSPESVIEGMYLMEAQNKFISNFSSGMKQRVKLGLAFYTDTPVLFLDEPGTNLDRQAFTWYHDSLKQLGKGRLIIIATNQSEEYPENSLKLDLMQFKPVVAQGTK